MMSDEWWLRQRFAAAERPPEPPDRLEEVIRRGRRRRVLERGAVLAAVAVVVLAVPLVFNGLDRHSVVLDSEPSPGRSGAGDATSDDDATPTPGTGELERVEAQALGAPVLAWGGSDGAELERIDGDGARVLWPGPVQVAIPDRQGGVLVQPTGEPAVVWLPDPDEQRQVHLAQADGTLLLRALLPDGRALYSQRPGQQPGEGDVERFFAVALAEGAEPEQVATTPALEQWRVGPTAAAGGEPVHVTCHLHCGLRPGLAEDSDGSEPLYQGTTIEGLTATPDGRVVGFVEFDPTGPERNEPDLVLLDGASFETLARIGLPLQADDKVGQPVVSLSADGQRALVALGGDRTGRPPVEVPPTPYLVDAALTDAPRVYRVDAEGALIWADADAATAWSSP